MASCDPREECFRLRNPFDFNFSPEKLEKLSLEISSEEPEPNSDESFQEFASMDLFDADGDCPDRCLNYDSKTKKVIDYSSDEEELTEFDEENRRIYCRQIVSSGGFDLDDIPGLFHRNFFPLKPLNEEDEEYHKVCRFSKLGIETYNSGNGTNYAFVKYVKAVWSLVAGLNYYLTFEAKEAAADCAPTPTTFQALVYEGIRNRDGTEHVEVVLVRMKSRASKEDNRILLC